jgi:hypothetical protein
MLDSFYLWIQTLYAIDNRRNIFQDKSPWRIWKSRGEVRYIVTTTSAQINQ